MNQMNMMYFFEKLKLQLLQFEKPERRPSLVHLEKIMSRCLKLYLMIDNFMKIFKLIEMKEVSPIIFNFNLLFKCRNWTSKWVHCMTMLQYKGQAAPSLMILKRSKDKFSSRELPYLSGFFSKRTQSYHCPSSTKIDAYWRSCRGRSICTSRSLNNINSKNHTKVRIILWIQSRTKRSSKHLFHMSLKNKKSHPFYHLTLTTWILNISQNRKT